MKTIKPLFTLIILTLTPNAINTSSHASHDIISLRMAHDNMNKGDFTKQRINFLKIEAQHDNIYAMNELGIMALSIHEYQDAIAWFLKAIAIDPKKPVIQYNLGNAYHHAGTIDLAKKHFIISAEYEHVYAYKALGSIALDEKDYASAIEWYEKALEKQPTSENTCSLALAYHLNGEIEHAIALYKDAADGEDTFAMKALANIYLVRDDYKEAIQWFSKAVAITHDPKVIYLLAYSYHLNGNKEKALHYFKQAAEKGNLSAIELLGDIALDNKDYKQAIRWFNRAIKCDGSNATYHNCLAYAYEMTNNHIKSQRHYKKATQLQNT